MPHDVFISYPSLNKTTADAICAKLEENRIRCWIAPRDVLPGKKYAEALLNAIDECQVFILVFSENTNHSPHIISEVQRAFVKNKVIIPFRIENIEPSTELQYFIGTAHWLDALTPTTEKQIVRLVDVVQRNLGIPSQATPETPTSTVITHSSDNTPKYKTKSNTKYYYLAGIFVLIFLGWIVLGAHQENTMTSPHQNLTPPSQNPTLTTIDASDVTKTTSQIPKDSSLPAGCVAYYSFNDGTAHDSINGYTGTIENAITLKGKSGDGFNFNGANAYISLPRMVSNDFSISFWVNTDQFVEPHSTGGSLGQWYRGQGLVDADVCYPKRDFGVDLYGSEVSFGTGPDDQSIFTINSVNDNTWHHVVATRNSKTGGIELFMDGKKEATATTKNMGSLTDSMNIIIGNSPCHIQENSNWFNGNIDEIMIFNRVLSQNEVARLYHLFD